MQTAATRVMPGVFAFLVLVFALAGCGGGGGDGGAGSSAVTSGTAPSISNLTFSPTFVFVDEGGGQTEIVGSIDFADPDGDLASFVLDVFDDSGQLVANVSQAVSASGITAGTLQGTVTIGTTNVGDFNINVYVTDSRSAQSNTLTGQFRIVDYPYVSKAAMLSPRLDFSVGVLDGQIYLVGGRDDLAPIIPRPQIADVDRYDPATDQWTAVEPLPLAVSEPIVAAVGGKLYAIGGETENLMLAAAVQEFDPLTGHWTTRAPMPEGRWGAAVAVIDDKIYIAGGRGAGVTYDSLAIYDPVTNTWSSGSPMTDGRSGPGGAAIGGRLFVYGGYGVLHIGDGGYLRSLESYDPAMDIWTILAEGEPREDFGVATANGVMYAFGGKNVARSLDWVQAYDPAADAWRDKISLPVSSGYVRAAALEDKIYLFTTDETFEYTPANDPR